MGSSAIGVGFGILILKPIPMPAFSALPALLPILVAGLTREDGYLFIQSSKRAATEYQGTCFF
jgi:hypothetical protein